jgi:hypothetical protein
MPIMSDAKFIEKVSLRLANFLVGPLSLGPQTKKNYVVLSTFEAEYVATGSCCA